MAGNDMEARKALSCELAVPDNMPPTFVWHTFEDKSVDCRNSLELGIAMKEKGIPLKCIFSKKVDMDLILPRVLKEQKNGLNYF